MTDMNISPEDLNAMLEALGGGQVADSVGVLADVMNVVEQAALIEGGVPNVIKDNGYEFRCIVLKDGYIKPTRIDTEEGTTFQEYNPQEDVINWLILAGQERVLLRQDERGVVPVNFNEFHGEFKEKQGYALSFLSSFNSNNNMLMDEDKVKTYEGVTKYMQKLMGDNNHEIRDFLVAMLVKTPNWEEVTRTWDTATVFDGDDHDTFTWGCEIETTDKYVKFLNTYAVMWITPKVMDPEGNLLAESVTQIIVRQVNPETVPQLSADSVARVLVDETLNKDVVAYALITDDTLSGKISQIRLYQSEGFDVNKTSF